MGGTFKVTSCLLGFLSISALNPVSSSAQVAAGVTRATRLEVSTASGEARDAFTTGMTDLAHGYFDRGNSRLKRAIDLDPTIGLARVIYGATAAGLTQPQRAEEISRGLTDASKASTGELLLAMAYRENFRQNVAGARTLLASAGELLPDEPLIPYMRAVWAANLPGGAATDRIPELKRVVERFPDYGPAYNLLAYAQWQAGQKGAAITTATTYMQKAPQHPNSHDTYAELAQWDGRYDDAVKHYSAAIQMDSTFLSAFHGLAEVYMLQGKGDLARQTLQASLAHSTTPAQTVTAHNRIANTYVLEGNTKAALASFGTAAAEAEKASLTGQVAGAHAAMMQVEAALGDPKNVAAHDGHIRALPPPPTPPTPQATAGRLGTVGSLHAYIGQTAIARAMLDSLTQLGQTSPSPVATNQTHHLTGWLLYSEGKPAEAVGEFRKGNPANPTARVGIALSQLKAGNVVEARSIRDEMINDRNLNLANTANVVARRLLKQKIQ